ncbi:MAG: zinc ribbon domain-containing protein, partial [Deltaproteobacteria bacterium]|nr:zinc ribbon domain-containing protein [Deltaproteobacteria bacterium]
LLGLDDYHPPSAMPLYEYRCLKCEKDFEFLQKISEKPKSKCPACAGKLKKLVSESGFQLKGTGWYVTDFRDKGKKKEEKKGPAKETKPESKPAPKPATT